VRAANQQLKLTRLAALVGGGLGVHYAPGSRWRCLRPAIQLNRGARLRESP